MSIFKKLFQWIAGLLGLIRKYVTPAVLAVESLKLMINNPALDIITALTKTTQDDKWLKTIRQLLPEVLSKLNLVKDISEKTPDQAIREALQLLASMDKSTRANLWNAIAALLGELLSDGQLETKYAIAGTPRVYQETIKGLEV